MSSLNPSALEHFRACGWVRVPAAFRAADAAAMCEVIWSALAKVGIERDDPSTWTETRPVHLQHLKSDPVFRAIGTDRTMDAIRQVLEDQPLPMPKDWGAFFLHFPTGGAWNIPGTGWHLDGNYAGRLSPPCGILIHSMLTDVRPHGGGTNIISGSHRLVYKWFSDHPPAPRARSAQLRKSLRRHPYLRDLSTAGDAAKRIARFFEQAEVVDGIPLQVVENTASAGDLILMHSLVLHAIPAAHVGTQPRFLLSTGIREPYWQTGSTE
jgi:hypothetical protein